MGRKKIKSAVVAVVIASGLILWSGCSVDETVTVSADQVSGVWVGPDGITIDLARNRKFTESGFDSGKLAENDCPNLEDRGAWGFFVDGKHSEYMSQEAQRGDWIGLSFTQQECVVGLAVVDGGDTLCATDDPDLPCSLGVRLKRKE